MIKNTLVVLFLFFSSIGFAQLDARFTEPKDTLINVTDNTVQDTISFHNFVYLISRDTGATYTDSIVVEGYDSYFGSWISCGLTNMTTNTNCIATNTANAVTAYLINIKFFGIIRARLINASTAYPSGTRNLTNYYLVNTN